MADWSQGVLDSYEDIPIESSSLSAQPKQQTKPTAQQQGEQLLHPFLDSYESIPIEPSSLSAPKQYTTDAPTMKLVSPRIVQSGGLTSISSNAPSDFKDYATEAANKAGLPPELVHRVIQRESAWNPKAQSPVGAGGLMQLMPGTARGLGVTDRFDPKQNIDGGVGYLRQMIGRYKGDMTRALVAYNWGPGNADKWNGDPNRLPAETRKYISSILGPIGSSTPAITSQQTPKPQQPPPPQITESTKQYMRGLLGYDPYGDAPKETDWSQYDLSSLTPQEPEKPPQSDLFGGLGVIGGSIAGSPRTALASALRTYRNSDIGESPWIDNAIEMLEKASDERIAKYDKDNRTLFGIPFKELAALEQNLGYSVANLGVSFPVGLASGAGATAVAGPMAGSVAGMAAGTATSFEMARRASRDQFSEDLKQNLDQASIQQTGRPLSPDEWKQAKDFYKGKIDEYGLWEAGPESAENLFNFVLWAGERTPIGAALSGTVGSLLKMPTVKKLLANSLIKASTKFGLMTASELAQESITQAGIPGSETLRGQSGVEASVGLRSPYTSWTEEAKEVVVPTVLLTAVTAPLFGLGGKIAGKSKHGIMPSPDQTTTPTAEPTADQQQQPVADKLAEAKQRFTVMTQDELDVEKQFLGSVLQTGDPAQRQMAQDLYDHIASIEGERAKEQADQERAAVSASEQANREAFINADMDEQYRQARLRVGMPSAPVQPIDQGGAPVDLIEKEQQKQTEPQAAPQASGTEAEQWRQINPKLQFMGQASMTNLAQSLGLPVPAEGWTKFTVLRDLQNFYNSLTPDLIPQAIAIGQQARPAQQQPQATPVQAPIASNSPPIVPPQTQNVVSEQAPQSQTEIPDSPSIVPQQSQTPSETGVLSTDGRTLSFKTEAARDAFENATGIKHTLDLMANKYDFTLPEGFDATPFTGQAPKPTIQEKVDQAANEAATSPLNDRPEPTEGQIKAGNYKKGSIRLNGLDISIENPIGSVRRGKDEDGKAWETTMQSAHYGYIKGTKGRDKDHLDVFVGPNTDSQKVFVVDQISPKTGRFDEHKSLIGFDSPEEARQGYLSNYEPGWLGLGAMTEMSLYQFKDWVKTGDTTKRLSRRNENQTTGMRSTPTPATGARRPLQPKTDLRPASEGVNVGPMVVQKPVNELLREQEAEAKKPKKTAPEFIDVVNDSIKRSQKEVDQETADKLRAELDALKKEREAEQSTITLERQKALDKYIEKAKEYLGEERARERGLDWIAKIDAKDIVALRGIMNGINPNVNKLFTAITGLPAKTQKEADASLRSLDPNKWDTWQEKKKIDQAAKETEREARAKKDAEDYVLDEKVSYQGQTMTRREMYRQNVEEEGFTRIERRPRGAVEEFFLVNFETKMQLKIPKKAIEYVQGLIDAKRGDQDVEKMLEASNEDLDRLFGVKQDTEQSILPTSDENPPETDASDVPDSNVESQPETTAEGTPDASDENLSDQEKSNRAWAVNYEKVLDNPTAASEDELHRAMSYMQMRVISRIGDKIAEGETGLDEVYQSLQIEYEGLKAQWRMKREERLASEKRANGTSSAKAEPSLQKGMKPPTIPDTPRPLEKVYGKNWMDRPDAAELKKEYNRKVYERSKALKAYKAYVEKSNEELGKKQDSPDDSEISPKVEAEKEQGVLDDFGQKLGGAKKDRSPSLQKEFSDDDMATMSFSEIWPKSEVDAIEDKSLAAIATALRGTVPSKPRKGYKVQRWIEGVKLVRTLMGYVEENGKAALLAKMAERRSLEQLVNKITLLEGIDREQWGRVGKVEYYPYAYSFDKDGKKSFSPYAFAEIDGKSVRAKSMDELVLSVSEKFAGEAKPSGPKMEFEVRGREGAYFINKKGDPLYRKLKTFETSKEALDYKSSNYDALVLAWDAVKESDNVKQTDVRGNKNRPRAGADYRNGKSATPEMFSDAFGFRGVEFGNWVGQGKNIKERQGMLDAAYDALMDLSNILNIPPKAISLNGSLGLGFGSRGSGWASAHYEPDTLVINLTKPRGAGALAHEWFHAMDNYFQGQRGPMVEGREGSYITQNPETYYQHEDVKTKLPERRFNELKEINRIREPDKWKKMEGVRPQVAEAFADLVKAIDDSPMSKRSALIDKGKSKGYWSSVIERAARTFENYIIAKMQQEGYHNDYLANVVSIKEFSRNPGRYPYLLDEELKPVSDAFDNLFATIQTKETDKGTALYSMNTQAPTGIPLSVANDALAFRIAALRSDIKVVVAPSTSPQVPAGVYREGSRGAFDPSTRTAYVFTDQVSSVEEAAFVFDHEIPGHMGTKEVLGKREEQFFREMAAMKRKDLAPYGDKATYGFDLSTDKGRIGAAKEWFADQIAAGRYNEVGIKGWWNKFVKLFNDGLRALGWKRGLSESEIAEIALKARQAVNEKGGTLMRGASPVLATQRSIREKYNDEIQGRNQSQYKSDRFHEQRLRRIFEGQDYGGTGTISIVRASTEDQKIVREAAKALGLDARLFSTTDARINGIGGLSLPYDNRSIYININADNPIISLLGHEATHVLKQSNQDLYKVLHDLVIDNISEKASEAYSDRIGFNYQIQGLDKPNPDKIFDEFVADFVGDQFADKRFWDKLAGKSPTLTQRLVEIVQAMLDKIKRHFKLLFGNESQFKDLDKMQSVLAEVMGEFSKRQNANPDILASYAGPTAKGWDEATGKFSSLYDRKERFEIDDSGMKLLLNDIGDRTVGMTQEQEEEVYDNLTLKDVLDHPKLYKNYPLAADIKVKLVNGANGSYNPNSNVITVAYRSNPKKQILHELQHAIQEQEGFARGGTPQGFDELLITPKEAVIGADIGEVTHPGEWKQVFGPNDPLSIATTAKDLIERGLLKKWEMNKLRDVIEKNGFDSLNDAISFLKEQSDRRSPVGQYTRLAGEIEARDAAARSNLPPEQRAKTPPYSSENIDPEDAIVRFGGGEAMMESRRTPDADSLLSEAKARAETSSAVQALFHHLRERNETGFLGRVLRTAEYWTHPVGKEIFDATQDREEKKHQIFNQVLKATPVVESLTAFRNKGANVLRKLTGYDLYDLSKAPKEYRQIHDVLIHMDDNDRKWEDFTDGYGKFVKGYKTQLLEKNDTPKEVIDAVDGIRKMLDEALELQRAPIRKLLQAYERAGKAVPVVYREKMPDGSEKEVTLAELYNRMGDLSGSYFPRRREAGDWGIRSQKLQRNDKGEVIKDSLTGGPKYVDYYFQQSSLRAAYEFRKRLQKEGHVNISERPFRVEKMPETIYEDLKIPDLQAALDRIVSGAELDPDTKAKMRSDLLMEAANLLKERGFRTSKIRRTGGEVVKGYIEDPLMAVASYAHSVAGGVAKSSAATAMFNALSGQWYQRKDGNWVLKDDDGEVLKSIPLTDKERESGLRSKQIGGIKPAKEPERYNLYTEYIAEQLRNPDATDRAIALGKSIVSFKYLGMSPRTVLVNATSLVTTAPAALHQYALGGKGSMAKVGSAILSGMRDYTKVMTGKKLPNADEQAFMDDLAGSAQLQQYTRDAMANITGAYGQAWGKIMQGAMYGFQKSEELIRGATMLAGYRLAKSQGKTHQEAIEAAKEASNRAHGIYGKATLPMWAMGQNPAAKIAQMGVAYLKFPTNYLQMMYELGFQKKNMKALAFAMIAPGIVGGAGATIMFPTIMLFAKGLLMALGVDDEPEKWVFDTIREELGADAEKASRFGLAGLAGVDISGSLSMGMQVPKTLMDLTGPFGGVYENLTQAGRYVKTGQPMRALEEAAPTVLANILRAARELDGATTRSGARIWDENGRPLKPSGVDTAKRALGFKASDRAINEARTRERKIEVSNYTDRRKSIYEEFRAYAVTKEKDPEKIKDILERVKAYNDAVLRSGQQGIIPLITGKSLRQQSMKLGKPSKTERRTLQRYRTEEDEED